MSERPSAPTSTFTSRPPTAPSSPPPASESFFSDVDSVAGGSSVAGGYGTEAYFDLAKLDVGALNLVSWKQGVDAGSDGSDRRGFNAISTVLAHPTKKANPLRSSRKPLPPLAQTGQIPKYPAPTHYDAYLQSITPLWESFSSAQASSSNAVEVETPKVELPSLDSIPELYFDTDFDLSNPATWEAVVGQSSSSETATISTEIQETLSTDLDHLERHLVHEISLRSSAFFSALSNLQDLHAESASCLERIDSLRGALREVGTNQANKGLDIIAAQAKLADLRHVEGVLRDVGVLEDTLETAEGLVQEGDWMGAVVCMEDIGRWWERHTEGEQPLTALPALEHYPSTVRYLCKALAVQLEGALGSLLSAALEAGDRQYDSETFKRNAGQLVAGLARCEAPHGVDLVWREAALNAVRESSRQHLPTSRDDDAEVDQAEGKGQNLARALRGMDHSAFVALAQSMYDTMLARLTLIQKVGEDLAAVQTEHSSLPSLALTPLPEPLSLQKLEKTDVLLTACELANSRAAKILAARTEEHADLSLEQFVEVFNVTWAFVIACEEVARRMIVALRGVTASQARQFLISYHGQRLTKSAKLVEEEQWAQVDVPASAQLAVDRLISAAVADPPGLAIPSVEIIPSANGAETQKVVKVEDRSFFVVNATLQSLQLIEDYLRIVINLELVVTDVMSRVIEFLKSFNSRTCQVVLGAGAMRSAGLKNITAKHLALASQSLSVVVALIPYIREFIRRHLSSKQAVMLVEFDKLKRDYQEHQNEIHSKLVAIMSDRLAVHCASLREIDWENSSGKDGPKPYVELLAKETATLHKVLSKYLATQTVETVMSQVVAAIVERLTEEYSKVEFKSEDAKKRMLVDVALLMGKLAPLSEAGSSISTLESVVKEKATPRKHMGQAVAGLLRRSGSAKNALAVEGESDDQAIDVEADGVDMGDEDEAPALSATEEPAVQAKDAPVEAIEVSFEDVPAPAASNIEKPQDNLVEDEPKTEESKDDTALQSTEQPNLEAIRSAKESEDTIAPDPAADTATVVETANTADAAPETSQPESTPAPASPVTEAKLDNAEPTSEAPAPPPKAPETPTKALPPISTAVSTPPPPERKLSLAERLRGVATAQSHRGSLDASPVSGRGE